MSAHGFTSVCDRPHRLLSEREVLAVISEREVDRGVFTHSERQPLFDKGLATLRRNTTTMQITPAGRAALEASK